MNGLTDEQIAFLSAQGKNVLCACPGSGKTFIVAGKVVKYLEKWNRSHQGVAVLSFTNVASEEILDQIEQINGYSGKISYPHFVGTVDSFINKFIVLQYGYLYNEGRMRPQIAWNNVWNYPFKFWRTECHKNGCTGAVEEFYYGLNGKLFKKNKEVLCDPNKGQKLPPCAQYKRIYEKKGILFQSEVSSFAYRILKENPHIALAIAQRFPVILIDEAQDTSEEQMAVFDVLFAAGVQEAFLVGDPDQSIYEWRNATSKCFVDKMQEEGWSTLFLTANFRSSQNICNAVQYFAQSLKQKDANVAKGVYALEKQKPILLLYPLNLDVSEIINYFIEKCNYMEMKITPENIAIVTRSRIHLDSDISGLWKSPEIEMLTKSAYEWKFGSRKKAYNLCEQAIFSIAIGDLKDEYLLKDEIGSLFTYAEWKIFIVGIMVGYPSLNTPIGEWINQFKVSLRLSFETAGILPRDGKEFSTVLKIKTRDKNFPDFILKPIKIFHEKKNREKYTLSSVHGVKGETYEAVLLHVKNLKGNTITPSFLNKGSLDSELMRIAYVGMTRPRRLLVVAMPGTVSNDEFSRFPKDKWEYIAIN